MSRQNTLLRRAARRGWKLLPVLALAASAASAPAAEPEDRITPGFERIEIPGGRVARRDGDGFERIGAPPARPEPPASSRSLSAGRAVSVARARAGEAPAPDAATVPPAARVPVSTQQEPWRSDVFAPPTPEGVENYRRRLEARLLEKYNNTPEWAGRVAGVTVVLSKPLETSIDGTMIRADFDQLVHDAWGKRIPELEKEYYVVTFGSEGVRQVRSDPSIRVGLDLEKAYSERAPLAGDPFRGAAAADVESFTPARRQDGAQGNAQSGSQGGMPGWWRPEYP